jgi:hypothetical protein
MNFSDLIPLLFRHILESRVQVTSINSTIFCQRMVSPFITKDTSIVDEDRDGPKVVDSRFDYRGTIGHRRGVYNSLPAR